MPGRALLIPQRDDRVHRHRLPRREIARHHGDDRQEDRDSAQARAGSPWDPRRFAAAPLGRGWVQLLRRLLFECYAGLMTITRSLGALRQRTRKGRRDRLLPGAGALYAASGRSDLRRLYIRKLGCHLFDADDVIIRAVWGARRERGPTF